MTKNTKFNFLKSRVEQSRKRSSEDSVNSENSSKNNKTIDEYDKAAIQRIKKWTKDHSNKK